jgi:Fic-DOC domain mobile mystery protein B
MSGLHDQPDDGATPLSPEEHEGLIPAHISLRRELNQLEQQNILEADVWAFDRQRPLTSETFAKTLHKRMYGRVWNWAGSYRTTEKNLGVLPHEIQVRLISVLRDFDYWIPNKTFPPDELGVHFHHALVVIHPFPNRNGRWSRLMGDLLAVQLGQPRFTWGRADLQAAGGGRAAYIEALQAADAHNLDPLIAFARS